MSQQDRRAAFRVVSGAAPRRSIGRQQRIIATALPDEARDFLQRAERLVYLLPDGYAAERLVADLLAPDGRAPFEFDAFAEPDPTHAANGPGGAFPTPSSFIGRTSGGTTTYVVEVRPRSVTIVAEPFGLRRDLLLSIKEHAEGRLREEAA